MNMDAEECYELAEACGLETVKEAVLNVVTHSSSLFPYEDIPAELGELYSETSVYGDDKLIEEIQNS